MLVFKKLSWSNAFSYGSGNSISFIDNQLTQIIAANGSGKSSIALILEEVLFNKNSKGTKRSDVLNRYIKDNKYTITLEFEKDGLYYTIETIRGTTQTVKFLCNGVDISEHTSTGTYKLIEDTIGYDHKTFTQVCYVSNPFSLEFLTTTDSKRKEFLTKLLDLTHYTDIYNKIKLDVKTLSNEVEVLTSKENMFKSWISKNKLSDSVEKEQVTVPDFPHELKLRKSDLESRIKHIVDINKKIVTNNLYISLTKDMPTYSGNMPNEEILFNNKSELRSLQKEWQNLDIKESKVNLLDKCTMCGQKIDNEHAIHIVNELRNSKQKIVEKIEELTPIVENLEKQYSEYSKFKSKLLEWEHNFSLIDKTLSTEQLDVEELKLELQNVDRELSKILSSITNAEAHNFSVVSHNSKIQAVKTQILEAENNLAEVIIEKKAISDILSRLSILQKAFSPSGFIAYKIEYLVKDLENLTNTYLGEMSSGRFQLQFKLSSSDKLDVVIVDCGKEVDISALSNGELSRVNVSTLLAIRKLMLEISNATTNLLILDETIESLDSDGKDKLIEVLSNEPGLNTILISHGFSHPLLQKLYIVKENNIARIENG